MHPIGMEAKLKCQIVQQFGKTMILTEMPLQLFDSIFEIDAEVQRKMDPKHRDRIKQHILRCLEKGEALYFAPFIFALRDEVELGEDYFIFSPGKKLYVIDSQHRSLALSSALTELKLRLETAQTKGHRQDIAKYEGYIEYLKHFKISMQIYIGLTIEKQRILFSDLNTKRKEANSNLQLQYDQRGEYNQLTREIAQMLNEIVEVEFASARLNSYSGAWISLSTIKKCLIALFEGTASKLMVDPDIKLGYDKAKKIAEQFFKTLMDMAPKDAINRKKYVFCLAGIQAALALTVFNLTIQNNISHQQAIKMLPRLKNHCSWRHDDALFQSLYDPISKRILRQNSTTSINRMMYEFIIVINKESDVSV